MAVTALSGQRWQGVLDAVAKPNCATFNGSNAVITGLGNLMSGSGAWSFSVWFRHVSGSGNDGMFSPDGTMESCFYQVASTQILVKMDSTATNLESGSVSNDTWYHLCGTKDSSDNLVLYLNGASVDTGTSTGTVTSDSWRFGYAHSSEFWAGNAIEFAVWNGRALTLAEVQSIYGNGGSTAKKIPDATLNVSGASYTEDLTGYYPMDTDFDKFAGTGGNNGSNANATVDNSSPATPIPADKDSVTDVPVGSEFEQTDNYKSYQRGLNEVGTGWTTSGGDISETDGIISYTMDNNSVNSLAYKSLGETAGTTWNLRYKLIVTTDDIVTSATVNHTLGVTDYSSGFAEDPSTSSKTIYMKHAYHADNAAQYWTNGSTEGNDWGNGISSSGAITRYVETVMNDGTETTTYYTGSDYSTGGTSTASWAVDSTANGGTKNKIFINVFTNGTVSSGSVVATISDIVFSNNSTTTIAKKWVERGTAI